MTGLNSVSPITRWILAVLILLSPALTRLAAQPLNPPAGGGFGLTNTLVEPVLVRGKQNGVLHPTKEERDYYVLAMARYCANIHEYPESETNYISLLADDKPVALQQTALLELANVVRLESDFPRAEAIYGQYLQHWPGDAGMLEVYLRQGQVFRDMGLPNMAFVKFYAVMTAALALTNNQLAYYKTMVLRAQVEIADTYYSLGKFKDAMDYYSRLLAQNDPELDREQVQFRLIRSLEAVNQHDEAVSQARDFLEHYPNSTEEPEVRYHLAQAYKSQNRNTEALQEVKTFLKEERDKTTNDPAVWTYWQQRVGNEIGNQLYQEGDYVKALQVYLALAQLDPSPAWQLPVRYQVGLTYEKLLQPSLAMEVYRNILTNAVHGAGANLAPGLQSLLDMASWRLNFLEWNARAEPFVHQTVATTSTNLNQNRP